MAITVEAQEMTSAGTEVVRSRLVYRNMRDPAMLKYYYKMRTINLVDKEEISGSSPPDLFIGSFGYPKVFIGPMLPPVFGDTAIFSTPEMWRNLDIPKIVEYRSILVRGMHKADVHNVENGKIEEVVRDFALAGTNADAEMIFSRKPNLRVAFDENSQPFGPSAPLKEVEVGNMPSNRDIESAYSDTDMNATQASVELYQKGVPVSRIQRALSAGVLGVGRRRKFVPTRWSITAVDDALSKANLEEVKAYNTIDSPMAYEGTALDNRWLILMFPGSWTYESIEAWYPNTTWNTDSKKIAIYGSHEFFNGRSTYAEIGGCYYAARLAVSELFKKIKKQATVVILREVHSGYIMPVGVWNVREHVREVLGTQPLYFHDIHEAMKHVEEKMDIRPSTWIQNSRILKELLLQRRLFS